jgi:hypothetical protein
MPRPRTPSGILRRGSTPGPPTPRSRFFVFTALLVTPVQAAEPIRLELTNASTVLYAGDNRDTKPNQVATLMNDDFGVFMNRFNAHASQGRFRASLRLDNAWYFTAPDATEVALELVRTRPADEGLVSDPQYFRSKVDEAGRERSNRYINWLYPAKYSLGYAAPSYELTLGDVYAEFGRGLVLSVRKLDELSSDTTLRGGRLSANTRAGGLRLGATLVGGAANPLRIDETSGRYLGVHSSSAKGLFAVTEAGMPRAVVTDFAPESDRCSTSGTCGYEPDRVFGAQLSVEHARVKLGTQGSWLVRGDALSADVVRRAREVLTLSQSLELTSEGATDSLYVEAAGQKLTHDETAEELDPGYAVYAAATLIRRPLIVLVEAKHYRRFFPLYANVDTGVAREFSLLALSAPPTTEESYVDTEFEGFNTCVSGGRARYDLALAKGASLLGWVGYYQTFAESVSNERCDTSGKNRNAVLDLANGFELRSADHRSRGTVTLGTRFDDASAELRTQHGTTHVFYRELYARYDAAYALPEPFVLELQGFHRRRRETLAGVSDPWLEGSHTTGLGVGAAWSFAFGFEYDTNPLRPDTYFNGAIRFRPTSDSSIALFAGQQRGALRCVGGVCRVFPPFEGARLDGTVRF